VRFSDGQPFDADDVIFTFQAYLDEKVNSPQRNLLMVNGKPIGVRKIDSATVEFDLGGPYGPAERIFDSIAILPRHLLEAAYKRGQLAQQWDSRRRRGRWPGWARSGCRATGRRRPGSGAEPLLLEAGQPGHPIAVPG